MAFDGMIPSRRIGRIKVSQAARSRFLFWFSVVTYRPLDCGRRARVDGEQQRQGVEFRNDTQEHPEYR